MLMEMGTKLGDGDRKNSRDRVGDGTIYFTMSLSSGRARSSITTAVDIND